MAKLSSTSSNAEAEADLRREAAHAAEAALLAERRQNSMMRRDQRVLTEVCGLCVRVCVRMFVCVWLCVAVWLCMWLCGVLFPTKQGGLTLSALLRFEYCRTTSPKH